PGHPLPRPHARPRCRGLFAGPRFPPGPARPNQPVSRSRITLSRGDEPMMRYAKLSLVLVVLPIAASVLPAAGSRGAEVRPRMDINLSEAKDYGTELPFVDVFRLSRPWISQRKGADWGKGPPLELDECSWVKRLEPDCWAETLLCT